MVRGGCKRCGQRTPNNRLCKECQRLERQDFFATDVEGYESNDRDEPEDELEYECTACGAEYTTAGQDPCPECGARRRRYIGPIGGGQAVATDGEQDR